MIRFILLDIEGTTTDIHFVHQVLFPYSAKRLSAYINEHANMPSVQEALQSVQQTVQAEESKALNQAEVIEVLLRWIQQDRKHTALKQLQGLIWKEGFEQLHYQGHVYDDVPKALQNWKRKGIGLGIYSSGSVQAQKLLFAHSVAGNLTPMFGHYFDTQVGAKQEVASYQNIAAQLNLPPIEVLFLSDIEAELDAARLAGLQVIQIVREGTKPSPRHQHAPDLLAIEQHTEIPFAGF
ncbi:acireductone synthase [Vampirovibrio sp.]|uniref:acireductone synthase n=1 Tax=Vampirovibrio sp. TaxID=2717857 RepID=UPI00359306CD